MKFPLIMIKAADPALYFFMRDEFGLISKNGESFYNRGLIYDSDGTVYSIKGTGLIKRASLIKSLKYFQPMYITEIKVETISQVSPKELKQLIVNHIQRFKKYWIKRDLPEDLSSALSEKESFSEIITFLR